MGDSHTEWLRLIVLLCVPQVQLFSKPGFQGSVLTLDDSVASLQDGFSLSSCKVLAGRWAILHYGQNIIFCCSTSWITGIQNTVLQILRVSPFGFPKSDLIQLKLHIAHITKVSQWFRICYRLSLLHLLKNVPYGSSLWYIVRVTFFILQYPSIIEYIA